ncbi:MAG: methyltransferase domain-containing protein [Desulfobacterales bacterium]|jgi:FKBP-type peptidyl-prolyl cis-trans isomerase 2
MNRIDTDSIVDLMFHLKWKSGYASHTDCYQASNVNVWRDHFPPVLLNSMMTKSSGDRIELSLDQDEILPAADPKKIFRIDARQFDRNFDSDTMNQPRQGRYYPKGILKGIANVFKENVEPFRIVNLNNGYLQVDLNHPLSGKSLKLTTIIGRVEKKNIERGGSSLDWIETLTSGPGMQARWENNETDYFCEESFYRDDITPDSEFYSKPRLVQHIDDTAIEMVRNTYDRFVDDGMRVLDLMSSWQSHFPHKKKFAQSTGLGLNAKELQTNPQLHDYVVQDLNKNGVLPFESDHFDVVTCTVSIEYLIHPLAVFDEIARVLRPNGNFVITFSNRYFPTKAIQIWKDIHEFERMGLVLEYFIRSGKFKDLQTYSIRGLPRPREDKYYPDLRFSDPLYAVWGQKL